MTFLNDLWKKFKVPISEPFGSETTDFANQGSDVLEQEKPKENPPISSGYLQNVKGVLDAFQQNEFESLSIDTVLYNLRVLKSEVDKPLEQNPSELRFSKIQQHLGIPECHETIRQERWHINIHCPSCRSTNLKRLAQIPPKSPHNHRYRCQDCETEFNDDTGTPMERGAPPLNVWMQCWYLMGCTDSLAYIASKLNLDLGMVEHMVQQLQKTFHAQRPLTRFTGHAEWSRQADALRKQLKEELLKQYERLSGDVATAPKDTAEFRRQQNLRRTQTADTSPPSPTSGKKRK